MIKRFQVDEEYVKENFNFYKNYITTLLEKLDENIIKPNYILKGVATKPLEIARMKLVTGELEGIEENIQFYIEAMLIHFQQMFDPTEKQEVQLLGKTYTVPTKIDDDYKPDLYVWSQVYDMINFSRAEKYREKLLSYYDACYKLETSAVWQMHTKFIQNIIGDNDEVISLELIQSVVDTGIVPFIGLEGKGMVYSPDVRKQINTLRIPILELYDLASKNLEDEFNKKLEDYLINRKAFIKKENNQDHRGFWIDFAGLAVCAFAYDKGMNITVKSEYIPEVGYKNVRL